MDFSELKLQLYDLAAIVLPGVFLIGELAAFWEGVPKLLLQLRSLHGTGVTLLLICSFATGNLVQEAGDKLIKRLKGGRFFRRARDRFWDSENKKMVCDKIVQLGGPPVDSVDMAFDFCVTRLQGSFSKRDVFLAISDLSRSLWVLSAVGLLPLSRAVIHTSAWGARLTTGTEGLSLIALSAWLSWGRMVRFRELSEVPVFHAFLAQLPGASAETPEPPARQ